MSSFIPGNWQEKIDVRDFVTKNITPYDGDDSFLCGPSETTKKLWQICVQAIKEERENNGVRAIDNQLVSTITSHAEGYIDRESEIIVGLQTDMLLKRAMKPYGGIAVVEKACQENGVEISPIVKETFTKYAKTHNDGV
ncbi:MAG: pyruvate formate lyase family protein, partial [Paludibacter sp.]